MPSQCGQDIADDGELDCHLESTTSPLKPQPGTLARLVAAIHAHFPPRPTVPLLEPLFVPIDGLPREDGPFVIHRTAEIVRPKCDSSVRVEKRLDIRQEPVPPRQSMNNISSSSPSAISLSLLTFKEPTPAKARKPLDLSYLSLDRYPFTPDTPRPIWDSDEDSDSD